MTQKIYNNTRIDAVYGSKIIQQINWNQSKNVSQNASRYK